MEGKWVDSATRAVVINFNLFNPSVCPYPCPYRSCSRYRYRYSYHYHHRYPDPDPNPDPKILLWSPPDSRR